MTAQNSKLQGIPAAPETQAGHPGDVLDYTRGIINTVREPMLVLDSALRIVAATRSFYRAFQVERDETDGRVLYEIGNGQWDIPALKNLLTAILEWNKAFEDFEVVGDFPGIGKRTMLLNGRQIWHEDGDKKILILLAIEDITERKRVETELLRSNEDLERFACVVAHDLRTPLGVALSLSQMLEVRMADRTTEREETMFKMVVENMQRLNQQMNDILSFSEAANAPRQSMMVPFKDALKMVLENLKDLIEKSGAEIVVNPYADFPCDRTLVAMVLQNLIGNAIKYRSESAPHIVIDIAPENGSNRISIRDNGEGFPQSMAEEIFEPFHRISQSAASGSGIGLATCKRIVERLGGAIGAKSVPGEGSVFSFTLPAA